MKANILSMMKYIRNRHFFISDIVLLIIASYLCFVVRFDSFVLDQKYYQSILTFTLLMVPLTLVSFYLTGIYRRYWQYASVEEMVLLAGSTTLAAIGGGIALVGAHMVFIDAFINIPRSIPFVFLPLALLMVATPRIALRVLSQMLERHPRPERMIPVLIVGAGRSGTLMVREIQQNPQLGFYIVGFIDDNPDKQKMKIHNIAVLGTRNDIPDLVKRHNVEQVIIAMPAESGKTIRGIVDICETLRVPTRTMPGIYELLDGKVRVNQLRPVQIEDLLRREPVQTNIEAVQDLIAGNSVLITGAGGSIGSELCRQVLRCKPSHLILVGHGENSIFAIHNELQKMQPGGTIHPVIADLRFKDRLQTIFERHRPHIVFHAAAHKHVPLMESNPTEAVTNNVLGTRNLLEVSESIGVEHFVMISSDKAVNSANIMGATKRVAELLVHQAAQRSGKSFVSVRFGNVLGSRGSVVLTFKEQIAAGGPVTVTHPEMTRYFMTIPEAVQLVLQAAVLGHGGEVFVLDMGEPVKIVDLARDMIELSGLQVGQDIDIVFTGLRPGEKMYEELFVEGEQHQPTIHSKIRVVVRGEENDEEENDKAMKELTIAMNGNDTMNRRNGQNTPMHGHSITNGHSNGNGKASIAATDALLLDRTVDALIHAAHREDEQAVVQLLMQLNPALRRGESGHQTDPAMQSSKPVQEVPVGQGAMVGAEMGMQYQVSGSC